MQIMFTSESFKNLRPEQLKVLYDVINYAYAQAVDSRISILVDDANDDGQQEFQCKILVEVLDAIEEAR